MVDFLSDMECETRALLEQYRVKYKSKDDLHTLLVKLYTFLEKYIAPQKRGVFLSRELIEKIPTLRKKEQIALEKLQEWTENGEDINGFQSRGLHGNGSRDYQNMLYGVVHLHLTATSDDEVPAIKKDGMAKPGEYILIAKFTPNCAYYIDVIKHPEKKDTEWTSKSTLVILANNWPQLIEGQKLTGMTLCLADGTEIQQNDIMIHQLTTNHINTAIKIGDDLYIPYCPISSSGHSGQAVMKADKTIKEVRILQNHYQNNKDSIETEKAQLLRSNNKHIPAQSDVHLEYFPELKEFCVFDRASKVAWAYRSKQLYLFEEQQTSVNL